MLAVVLTNFERAADFFWTGGGLGEGDYYGVYSHNAFVTVLYDYGIGGLTLYTVLISQ